MQWTDPAPADKAELEKLAGLRDGINGVIGQAMRAQGEDLKARTDKREHDTKAKYDALDKSLADQKAVMDASVREARRDSAVCQHPDLGTKP